MVSIRSSFGTRSASTTTNKLDDTSLRASVDLSERLAKLAPEDPEAMPELDAQTYDESPGWSTVTANLDPAGRAAAVRAVPYGQDEFLAARRGVASSRDRGRLSQVRGEE